MFKTLRSKLLFWFLFFVSTNFVIIFIYSSYLQQREKIADVHRLLEETHGLLLEDYKNQLNFFTNEVKNRVFYEFGTSHLIDYHKTLFKQINKDLELLSNNEIVSKFDLNDEMLEISNHLHIYDSIFYELVDLIKYRGYKDYNLIGQIRKSAHQMERKSEIKKVKLLNLRRAEKDYLLRYENIYLKIHNRYAKQIKTDIASNSKLSEKKKQDLNALVDAYLNDFRSLVALDRQLGLSDNTGVKGALDEQEKILVGEFVNMLKKADEAKIEQFNNLRILTIVVTIIFIAGGVLISIIISQRITVPLTDLTAYITRFVSSKFTYTNKKVETLSNDEIGKLTLNFNVMRDKIIEQLQFFKQKVEERTEELAEANERLQRINKANQRFVPIEFLHFLDREGIEDVQLGDNVEQNMTIMFSDIRGFTKFSEKMTPQENFDFINAYLKEIVPHVREHNGFVDKYIGDSVMALFTGSVEQAIDSAIASQTSVRRFNRERQRDGKAAIGVGIGLHTGRLILGTIGEPQRMETTVISDAVNTASRVEGLTSIYGASIIISEDVYKLIENQHRYDCRFVDKVMVKGKEKALNVYEILDGLSRKIHKLKMQTNEDFQEAIEFYKDQKFKQANSLFKKVLTINPDDAAAIIYTQRCEDLMLNGVPDDWDFAKKMEKKK